QAQRRAGMTTTRLAEAERQTQLAAQTASQQIAMTREAAARQVSEARDAALKAQTISDVLAAPDLVRYNLSGGEGAIRFSAQVLWSRSRGLVFSGSRLPPAAAGA